MLSKNRLFRTILFLIAIMSMSCSITFAAQDQKVLVVEKVKELPLTLEACVRIALDENPARQAAREGVLVARESVGMARASYYPSVALDTGYRRSQTHAFLPYEIPGKEKTSVIGPTDNWSFGVSARYLLFDSGKRAAQMRTALSRLDISREEESGIRQDIAQAVHKGFNSLVSTLEAQFVAQQNLKLAENHLRLTTDRWEVGAVPKADVIRSQVEVSNAKLQLVRANSNIDLARGSLNTAMGLPVEMKISLDIEGIDMNSPDKIDVSEVLDQAVRNRPELKAAFHRTEVSRNSIDIARSEYGPTVTARARYGYRDEEFMPKDEDWYVGIDIEWSLFEGNRRSHDVARAKHEFARDEALIQDLVSKVREEVWAAHTRLKESYEAISASEAILRNARESMRMTRERYEIGASTATDLLDAQTTLMEAEYGQVESRWNYFSARADFSRAVGTILENYAAD